MQIVKNINEKTRHQCFCGSWSAHLNTFGGRGEMTVCSEASCSEPAHVGSHVQFEGDGTWYMIALCIKHNSKDQVKFAIKPEAKKALASVAVTCHI